MPLTPAALDAMRYSIFSPGKKLFSFSIPEKDLNLFAAAAEGYLMCQLSQGFSSLDFYKSLMIDRDALF